MKKRDLLLIRALLELIVALQFANGNVQLQALGWGFGILSILTFFRIAISYLDPNFNSSN